MLENNNYTCDQATNGKQAWEKLSSPLINYDLILLDVIMPEMDGIELLSLIK